MSAYKTYKAECSIPNYRSDYFESQAEDLIRAYCTEVRNEFGFTVYEFEGLTEDDYDYLTELAYYQNMPEQYHRD